MSAEDGVALLQRFGMANQLAEVNLSAVENRFQIDLGRRQQEVEYEDEYFPQFDELVRKEAEEMSRHYEVFYCLEKTIRTLISESLADVDGANWWNTSRVPNGLKQEVEGRIQREMDSAVTLRSEDPIEFTTFGELGELIRKNWDVFGSIFSSERAVTRVLANLNVLRGPIAHCSRLAEDEVLRLELSLRDWFRLMD